MNNAATNTFIYIYLRYMCFQLQQDSSKSMRILNFNTFSVLSVYSNLHSD